MVVKLLFRLLEEGGFRWIDRDAALDVGPETSGRKDAKRREEEAARRRQTEERDESEERADKEQSDAVVDTLLVADALQQSYADLSSDIADAIRAVRLALEQALAEQEQARLAMEEAEAGALVLADGRRVYFTQDGKRLFGEDGEEITDEALIAEAERLRRENPNATTHETRVERRTRFKEASERVEQLATALDRLDDLERKVRDGTATPEELARARGELDEILHGLPQDVRTEYERIHDARKKGETPAYRDAGSEYKSALNTESAETHTPSLPDASTQETEPAESPARQPAYRSAPDF